MYCPACGVSLNASENDGADEFVARIVECLKSGSKIEAIKLYRERSGTDLRTAKDAVEEIAAKFDLPASRSGCASVILVCISLAGSVVMAVVVTGATL